MTEKTAKGNDPVEKTKIIERNYLVCDGCGYVIGWGEERTFVKVNLRDSQGYMRETEFHFHLSRDNKHDCMKYWWEGYGAREELRELKRERKKREKDEHSSSKAGS